MSEEVQNPDALLAAYNNLKEEIRKISAERDQLAKDKTALEEATKDDVWRVRALLAETKSALAAQGVKDVDAILKHVKVDGLDFDADGKLTGLDEKLKELKQDLPSVFDPKVRVGGRGDIAPANPAEPQEDPMLAGIRNAMGNR